MTLLRGIPPPPASAPTASCDEFCCVERKNATTEEGTLTVRRRQSFSLGPEWSPPTLRTVVTPPFALVDSVTFPDAFNNTFRFRRHGNVMVIETGAGKPGIVIVGCGVNGEDTARGNGSE